MDCHLFSQSADRRLQVARYGPALTQLLEGAPHGGTRQPLQTVTAEVMGSDSLLQRGAPAAPGVAELLTAQSAFGDVGALRVRIKEVLGQRHGRSADSPGFGGFILLRPEPDVKAHGDDLLQGKFSMRRAIAKRYVPAGFGVPTVTPPTCKVLINGCEAPMPAWSSQNRSPVYTRFVLQPAGYKLELRMFAHQAEPSVRYKAPSIRAVLQGTCIATAVPSKSFEATCAAYFDKVGTSNWTKRATTGLLDGHENDGFTALAALLSDTAVSSKNSATSIKAPMAVNGSQLAKPTGVLLAKDKYIQFTRPMRAVLGGDGIACLVSVTPLPGTRVDASNMFTADKGELKHTDMIREIRLFVHQAIVHWAPEAVKLKHPGLEPRWPKVIEEEEEGVAAQIATKKAAQDAAAAAAAEKKRTDAAAAKERDAAEKRAQEAVQRAAEAAAKRAADAKAQAEAQAAREAKKAAEAKARAEGRARKAAAAAAALAAETPSDHDDDEDGAADAVMQPADEAAAAAPSSESSSDDDDEEMEPAKAAAAPAQDDDDDLAGKLSDEEVEVVAKAAWVTPAHGHAPQEAQAPPAADGSAATTTPAPGDGAVATRKQKRAEFEGWEDGGGGAGGWDDDDYCGDDDFGAFAQEGPSRLRLGGLQPAPKCAACSRELTDPSLAARARAAQAEQQRKVQTLNAELADAKAKIKALEAQLLRIQG